MATKKAKGLPKKRQPITKAKKAKVIKSLLDLPKGKRATAPQVTKAKKAKAIKVKHKVIGKSKGRTEVSLGKANKNDVAGIIKGFRQKTKADFGTIIKDKDGNVIARTHTTRGSTTLAEQLVLKALSKYGKVYDEVIIVASVRTPKVKRKVKKK